MTNMHHLMILWLYILHYLTIANHSLFSERLLNKFFQVYWVCLQSWWCFSYITWIKTQVCTYIISLCKDDDKTSSASEWKWCQFPQRTDKFNTSFTLSRKSEFQLFQVVLYLCELGQGKDANFDTNPSFRGPLQLQDKERWPFCCICWMVGVMQEPGSNCDDLRVCIPSFTTLLP